MEGHEGLKHKDEAPPEGVAPPDKVLPLGGAQRSDKIQQLRKTRMGRTRGMNDKGEE